MIYVKSVLGGLAALLISFVLFIMWMSRLAPKGSQIGFDPALFVSPRILLIESAIFLAGFAIVWASMRFR